MLEEGKPIGPVEALKMALDKEVEAVLLYQALGRRAKAASDVFEFLVNEEMKHQKLIEEKIRKITA